MHFFGQYIHALFSQTTLAYLDEYLFLSYWQTTTDAFSRPFRYTFPYRKTPFRSIFPFHSNTNLLFVIRIASVSLFYFVRQLLAHLDARSICNSNFAWFYTELDYFPIVLAISLSYRLHIASVSVKGSISVKGDI